MSKFLIVVITRMTTRGVSNDEFATEWVLDQSELDRDAKLYRFQDLRHSETELLLIRGDFRMLEGERIKDLAGLVEGLAKKNGVELSDDLHTLIFVHGRKESEREYDLDDIDETRERAPTRAKSMVTSYTSNLSSAGAAAGFLIKLEERGKNVIAREALEEIRTEIEQHCVNAERFLVAVLMDVRTLFASMMFNAEVAASNGQGRLVEESCSGLLEDYKELCKQMRHPLLKKLEGKMKNLSAGKRIYTIAGEGGDAFQDYAGFTPPFYAREFWCSLEAISRNGQAFENVEIDVGELKKDLFHLSLGVDDLIRLVATKRDVGA